MQWPRNFAETLPVIPFTLTDSYLARKRNSKTDQNDCFLIKLQSSSRASRRGSSLLTIGITWMTLEWILHGKVFLGNKRWLSHFHFYLHLHFSIVIYILCVFFGLDFHIGLIVTVFDAILMSRQTCEKLQCLYENLMSNNFRKTPVLKKYQL